MLDTKHNVSTLSSYSDAQLTELALTGGVSSSLLKGRKRVELIELIGWLQDGKNKPAWFEASENAQRNVTHQSSGAPGKKGAKNVSTATTTANLRGKPAITRVKQPTRPKHGPASVRKAREDKLKADDDNTEDKKTEKKRAAKRKRRRTNR